MNVAYTIISVDESRAELKAGIRQRMSKFDIPEITDIEFVDARVEGAVDKYLKNNGLSVNHGGFHYGELGVWFSQINAWKYIAESDYDGVIVFEDDAVVHPHFDYYFDKFMGDLPEDYDFMALHVPQDQLADYYYNRAFNENGGWILVSTHQHGLTTSGHWLGSAWIATAYQGYAMVATMYSPKGARELLKTLDKYGLYGPADCWLFSESFRGSIKGYAPMPSLERVVDFKENGTIARSTGMYIP